MGHLGIDFKAKDKLLHFGIPTIKEEMQHLIDLFGFWRQHIPHLWVLFRLIKQVTLNVSIL